MNCMINSAKSSKFQLPFFLIPVIAFGLNLIGDMTAGTAAIMLCNKYNLSSVAANRVLLFSVALNGLLVILWVKIIECRKLSGIGICKRSFGKDSLIGAVAGFGVFTAILVIGYAANVVTNQYADFSFPNVASVFLMLPFWIIQSGSEEILTRGWVLPSVAAKTNRLTGILVSSGLFVLLHINSAGLNVIAVINIFLIGVLLAIYTLKSDSIWGAVMFHTFWNFTQGSVFGLSVSGNSAAKPNMMSFLSHGDTILSGGSFGIEASIITTIILAVLLIILLLINRAHIKIPKKEKRQEI